MTVDDVVPPAGIEPATEHYQYPVIPLNYGGLVWWAVEDSNL